MRSMIILALAALSVAACSVRTETVARETPSGRAVVAESASVGPPAIFVQD